MEAAARRDTAKVRQLLGEGAQVHPDRHALTPLHAAVGFFDRTCYERSGFPPPSPELLDLLIDAGAPLEAEWNGRTAVRMAAAFPEAVRHLVRRGATLGRDHGYGLLVDACRFGNGDLVRWLLKKRVILDPPEGHPDAHLAPVYWAATRLDLLRNLLDAGADPNGKPGASPLLQLDLYFQDAHAASVRLLLEAGADVHARPAVHTPIMRATYRGALTCARVLLESGADPHARDADGLCAVDYASLSGNLALIDLLMGTPLQRSGSKLIRALSEGKSQKEVMEILKGGVPPYAAQHALYRAIFLNQVQTVTRLIDLGADPGSENASLWMQPALLCAVFTAKDGYRMLRRLLDHGGARWWPEEAWKEMRREALQQKATWALDILDTFFSPDSEDGRP